MHFAEQQKGDKPNNVESAIQQRRRQQVFKLRLPFLPEWEVGRSHERLTLTCERGADCLPLSHFHAGRSPLQ
jgi:hypothetical protein